MKIKRPSNENAVQAAIIEWLAVACPDAIPVHIPNEGKRSPMMAALMKRIGLVVGAPDLVIFFPKSRAVLVECKDLGRVSPEQRAFGDAVRSLGFDWFVARSIDGMSKAFRALGIKTRETQLPSSNLTCGTEGSETTSRAVTGAGLSGRTNSSPRRTGGAGNRGKSRVAAVPQSQTKDAAAAP